MAGISLATFKPNVALMKNPMNYLTLLLMVIISAFAVDALVDATIRLRGYGTSTVSPNQQ